MQILPAGAVSLWGAAGLVGVWAESNTRASIYDALARKETFATSGPRIRVRYFAGWNFAPGDLDGDLAEPGYARGVPMGADLTAAPEGGSPTFLVEALKDSNAEKLGIERPPHLPRMLQERAITSPVWYAPPI